MITELEELLESLQYHAVRVQNKNWRETRQGYVVDDENDILFEVKQLDPRIVNHITTADPAKILQLAAVLRPLRAVSQLLAEYQEISEKIHTAADFEIFANTAEKRQEFKTQRQTLVDKLDRVAHTIMRKLQAKCGDPAEDRDMSIDEFCAKHFLQGMPWTLQGQTMQECWDKVEPHALLVIATQPQVLTIKERFRFAVYCLNITWHFLEQTEDTEIAQRLLSKLGTDTKDAACIASGKQNDITCIAARAAEAASLNFDTEADKLAAIARARAAQAAWLRKHIKPNFKKVQSR